MQPAKPERIETNPERVKAREAAGARIAVFVGHPGTEPVLVVNAATPEEEERVCTLIVGVAFAALKQGWHDAAVAQGAEAGVHVALRAVYAALGGEAARRVAAEIARVAAGECGDGK